MLLRLREKALGGDARALDRLIRLAQAYNNEELTAADAACLHDDDAALLEVFERRCRERPGSARQTERARKAPLRRSICASNAIKRVRVRLKKD